MSQLVAVLINNALSESAILAEASEELAPLIMPAVAFAGIAAAVFVALGFVVWSFRDVANRHSDKVSSSSQSQAQSHGAGH